MRSKEMVFTMAQVCVLPVLLHHLVAGLAVPDKTEIPKGLLPRSSPVAASVEDPRLGSSSVFPPVMSCLSSVTLVIYVTHVNAIEKTIGVYKNMYGPHVGAIEFYVDGTWCDPDGTNRPGMPCTGEKLERSTTQLPEGVNVVDNNGGGWLMQQSFVAAVSKHQRDNDGDNNDQDGSNFSGFLFTTDDTLLNLGQLTRAANVSGCDVVWRSDTKQCHDAMGPKAPRASRDHRIFARYLNQARDLYRASDEKFRARLARNTGSPSTYCIGTQNSFLYIPRAMSGDWARVAQQTISVELPFPFALHAATFGIADIEDMVVLRSRYLDRRDRSSACLHNSSLERGDRGRRGTGGAGRMGEWRKQSFCWNEGSRGRAVQVADLLAMHVIHPARLAGSEKEWSFAHTVNPPFAMPTTEESGASDVRGEGGIAFWCGDVVEEVALS